MILMIYTSFSTFVEADYEILSKKYTVMNYQYDNKKSVFSHFINQIKLLFWLVFNIKKCSAIYIWFADYHSFLPVLFGSIFNKKTFLVLGGYDVTYIKELNYGSCNNRLRSYCTKYSIKNAVMNLAVSNYVFNQAKSIVPKSSVKTIYNGVNPTLFSPTNDDRENIVITVGIIDSAQRIKLKGIDLFCQVASEMPDYQFVIVGITKSAQKLLKVTSPNLKLIESIPHKELVHYYQKAKIYCQLSMVESFCLTLVESMACGCNPIVSNVGALPEIVGECGFVVSRESKNEISSAINSIMGNAELNTIEPRKIATNNFTLLKREQLLFNLLDEYGIKNNGFKK